MGKEGDRCSTVSLLALLSASIHTVPTSRLTGKHKAKFPDLFIADLFIVDILVICAGTAEVSPVKGPSLGRRN